MFDKKKYQKEWRSRNKEHLKEYERLRYILNPERELKRHRDYVEKNREIVKVKQSIHHKKWYKDNKEKEIERVREWKLKNKDKIQDWKTRNKDKIKLYSKEYRAKNLERERTREHKKYTEDICFALKKILRIRIGKALKNKQKRGSAVDDLGCSVLELKVYLEKQFKDGMNWDNWGLYGWHIDHIKPLDSFDLTDRKQFLEATHYTNLQPMWAKDNIRKGNKISPKIERSINVNHDTTRSAIIKNKLNKKNDK